MAPTIYEDDMEPRAFRSRHKRIMHRYRQHSMIKCVKEETLKPISIKEEASSCDDNVGANHEQSKQLEDVSVSSTVRRDLKHRRDSDSDFDENLPTSLSHHNYAKRRRLSTDDESENQISSSSDLSEDGSKFPLPKRQEDLIAARQQLYFSRLGRPVCEISLSSLPSSPVSSTTDFLAYNRCFANTTNLPHYRRDLYEIALSTINLVKKNRSLQARLTQLKMETLQFVDSVMQNPENKMFRDDAYDGQPQIPEILKA